jgi:hypothetical protein
VRAVRAQVLGGPLRQVFGQIATLRTVGASQEG